MGVFRRELEVYCSPNEQPPLNRNYEDLTEQEKAVHDFFIRSENIDKLVSFLSLEEDKGHDKFDSRKCNLFKVLLRFDFAFLNPHVLLFL